MLAAGCGGGDDEHDAFVEQVNLVCKRHFDDLDALDSPQSSQQLLTYVEELTRLARVLVRDLEKLTPPAADRDDFRTMVRQMQATLALYPDLRDAVLSAQPNALESVVQRANSSNQKAGEAALELGAEECAPTNASETTSGR